MADDWSRDEILDDWVPLGTASATGNPDGGRFIDPTRMCGFSIIQYNADGENDVMTFFDVEASDLIKRLVEYQDNPDSMGVDT